MKGIIAWFAHNTVAANLLMFLILGTGILTVSKLKMEIFPEFSADMISVSVVYPGAAPAEVEEAICVRIEEAVQGLEGIKEISSTASENVGTVNIEVQQSFDIRKLLDDVKARVDAIDTFPDEAEEPTSREIVLSREVIYVAISGETDEQSLKVVGEQVRDEISSLPGVTQVALLSARPYEVAVEVSERALRQYNLTFNEVATAVRRSSIDLPGGSIRSTGGEILLRTKGQAYVGQDFENLVLRAKQDGTHLLLRDVATVVDGFAETDQFARFDGKPTVIVKVSRVGDENALQIAEDVKTFITSAQARLPDGIALTTWADFSRILNGRLNLMLKNGLVGFILVLLSLALFLRLRLAFWVALGIPISFLGAIGLMPSIDASINLISLFGFIVVLGIVVDDAIIVGENVYRHQQMGKPGLSAAIDGAREVSTPVIFAVLTSIAAFSPLLMVPGQMGKFMKLIPQIVILALIFSLVESLLVLPAHLGHSSEGGILSRLFGYLKQPFAKPESLNPSVSEKTSIEQTRWRRFQSFFSDGLIYFVTTYYRPTLEKALEWRYVTLSWGFATLFLTIGLVGGGWIKFVFFPPVDADNVVAVLEMPRGTPAEITAEAIARIEKAGIEIQAEIQKEAPEKIFKHMLASVGDQPSVRIQRQNSGGNGGAFSAAHLGEVNMELTPAEERSVTASEVSRRWRERVGPIPDATTLTYSSNLFSLGDPVNIQFSGHSYEELQTVAAKLKMRLTEYPGVSDISDSFRPGKKEVKLTMTRAGETLGLTLADLGRQVRQAFYGEEAQRIQRGRDDVKVMVRYPATERRSLGDLEQMRIRTPSGAEIPFSLAAEAEIGRGFASIQRKDRQKVVNVTADVDVKVANANEIIADLVANVLPDIMADHPRVRYSLEGEQREQAETMSGLGGSFGVALMMIYILLAIPFKSYSQPLIVMSAIPFGIVGAVWGHMIMGMDLTMLSMFGVVALTGVVVNDSLVMVDFINKNRDNGMPLTEAIREAGAQRFRPILLTSVTTFLGLSPILLEKSLQAQFLIPMAISLGFGVLFATFITLMLVPVLYIILTDIQSQFARWQGREPEPAELEQAA
jgi:multidrug efflux pump subunit AcrB